MANASDPLSLAMHDWLASRKRLKLRWELLLGQSSVPALRARRDVLCVRVLICPSATGLAGSESPPDREVATLILYLTHALCTVHQSHTYASLMTPTNVASRKGLGLLHRR
jgi:hypothetical protein